VDRRLRDLVPWFIARRREDVPVLLGALERGDFPGIRTLGHNMKGTGTGYGLARITDIGGAIESAAQEENRSEIRRQITDLAEYLDRVSIIYE
jgi:HPt (histidine-containing phosphotransfer) domain-containing protein